MYHVISYQTLSFSVRSMRSCVFVLFLSALLLYCSSVCFFYSFLLLSIRCLSFQIFSLVCFFVASVLVYSRLFWFGLVSCLLFSHFTLFYSSHKKIPDSILLYSYDLNGDYTIALIFTQFTAHSSLLNRVSSLRPGQSGYASREWY